MKTLTKIRDSLRSIITPIAQENTATIIEETSLSNPPYQRIDEASTLNFEKDPLDKWIADYTKSADARFKGLDKSARVKLALTDYAAAKKAAGKKIVENAAEEGMSMTRLELDEIADMADDLFNAIPNFDDCPEWAQHKIAAIHADLNSIYDFYRLKCATGAVATFSEPSPSINPTAALPPPPVNPAPSGI